jgi:Uncharacterized conserved protein
MGIPVKLQAFEGPLDLLLHLIDKNKVSIYDIPIVEITKQYLEYIRDLDGQDLDVMSEFLLMAATLLDIKSKMLLPKEMKEDGEEEEDPRQELVEMLLQYKLFKFMSYELKEKQVDASKALFKEPTVPKEVLEYRQPIDMEELVGDMTLAKLHVIFKSIVRKQEDKIDPIRSKFGRIEKEEVSLTDKIDYIEAYAIARKKFSFRNLLEEQNSKAHIIVTFLGILELMKLGRIKIEQEDIFEDIQISLVE